MYLTIVYLFLIDGSPTEKPRPEPELELVPATHKPKPKPKPKPKTKPKTKPKAHTYMDLDSGFNAEASTNAVAALKKTDKGKAKAIDLPEDLYESPTLKVCLNMLTLSFTEL